MWPVMGNDHRGLRVRLYRTGALPWPHAGDHPLPRGAWRDAKAMLDGTPARARKAGALWGTIVGLSIPAPMIVLQVARFTGFQTPPPVFGLGVGLSMGLLLGWWMRQSIWEGNPERVIAALLFVGHCPRCGYGLRACGIDADGCTVCPECGAAWRVGRRGPDGG